MSIRSRSQHIIPVTSHPRPQSGHNGSHDGLRYGPCSHPAESVKPLYSVREQVTGDEFVVGYCYRCRLHVTTPLPSENEILKYYPGSYYGKGRRFTGLVERLLRTLYVYRAVQVERKTKAGKVLDVGCGRGLLLSALRARGWDPYGTELSEEAALYAREEMGLPVTTQSLHEARFPDDEFDMVILWHVLEHMRAPRETLLEIGRILKPGGMLLVAVPNFGSWEARSAGPGWFHLDVPRHLVHWRRRELGQVLQLAGMSIKSESYLSVEYDFFSFVQTMQNRLGLRHNLLYDLLRTRSAKMLENGDKHSKSTWLQIALALATAVPLSVLSLLYVPFVAMWKNGATMTIFAVKEHKAGS